MKVAWANACASWSGLRARVGAFSLRERIITSIIAIVIFAGSYLALWGFLNQQGIWMGDLFFRKVSDDRYEASAHRYPEIGSTVTVELKPFYWYRVSWNGYEWNGVLVNDHLIGIDGKIITSQQMPFWGKVPNSYEDEETLHESYFILILVRMSSSDLEPLGNISRMPFPIILIFLVLLFGYLSPGGVHRIRCIVSGDYPENLTIEERQSMQSSAFSSIVIVVALVLIYTAQYIIFNWV